MKSKMGFVAGLAALGVAVYLSTHLGAQTTQPAPRPTSKIAVVNLPLVIKNYKKYLVYENELKAMAKDFQQKEEALKAKVTALQTKNDMSQDAKEQELKNLKRQAEDMGQEFKKQFSTKQEQQLITLYSEVENMVKRVAMAHGFEMVLQYADADPKEAHNPMVIQRKVLDGRCLPIYAASGLDITNDVYAYLNAYYDKATGAATGARPAAQTGAGH